jgi:phage gpG-like protein
MAHSFMLSVTATSATLSNPTPYAARHQFGDRDHVAGVKIGTVKTKYATAKFAGSWNDVMSGSKGMPARPFYPVINGKLTPAAENLITRAGQRAAARALGQGETK